MTQHPLTTLPPEALPGWAAAMRWTRDALLASAPMVATGALIPRVEDMLAIAEGLARQPAAEQRAPVTLERVAAWATRFESAALRAATDLRWYRAASEDARYRSLADALANQPNTGAVAVESSEWAGTRWAFLAPGEDGATEATLCDTREEAHAYLAEVSRGAAPEPTEPEATQEGLAEAVAESIATPAPQPEEVPLPERARAMRSDSPWTEERLALLARIFPTIMSVEAILEALNKLDGLPVGSPSAVRIKAEKLGIHRRGEPAPEEFAEAATSRSRVPQNAGTTARDHAHGRSENGGKPGTWTTEREAMLRRDYPGTKPLAGVFAALNALPGPPVASIGAVAAQAKKMGLQRRERLPIGSAIAPPTTTPIPPMTTEDQAEALERLRKGIDKGARDVMEYFGCSHSEAMQVVERHRARQQRAA